MHILHSLLNELKAEFNNSRKGKERGTWFVYTIVAIIVPFTSSKTSNLLRGSIIRIHQYQQTPILYFYGII